MGTSSILDLQSFVLNRFPYPSSLYKYAVDLVEGNSPNSLLFNIITNSNKWNNSHSGTDFKVPFFNKFYISGLTSKFTFRNITNEILKISNKDMPSIIHLVSPFASPVFTHRYPITVTIHDSPKALFKQGLYRMEKETLRDYSIRMKLTKHLYKSAMKLPALCTNSYYVADSMREFGYGGKLSVLPPPVSRSFKPLSNKNEIRLKLGLPLDRILILSVSIDEVRKNLDMVKMVANATKDWASVVRIGSDIGSGYTFNSVDDYKMNLIYNACDVLLMPSIEEGFGNPIVESFEVGLPVVASNLKVFKEVAKDSVIFVEENTVDSYVDGVKQALDQKEKLVKSGMQRVKEFEMERFASKVHKTYASIEDEYR